MAQALGSVLRVVGPAQYDAEQQARDDAAAAAADAAKRAVAEAEVGETDLSGFIRRQFERTATPPS